MKIGIFGGSFNPVHLGHLKIVEIVLERIKLDKIIIVPVGVPSHRKNNLIDAKHRLKMCYLTFKGIKKVEISEIEIDSNEYSYTYDTLMKYKKLYPNDEFYEIIGEDSADYFKEWKNYKEILQNSKIIVLNRKVDKEEMSNKESSLKNEEFKDSIIYIENHYEYSSTEIRERIGKEKKIKNIVTHSVEEYIKEKKLYNI